MRALSKGDYANFVILLSLSRVFIGNAKAREKTKFLSLVGSYISAIFVQGFAIGLFYFGVKHYIDENSIGYVTKVINILGLDLNKVEQLVLSLLPAILLLFISSKILSFSRVGLSSVVLKIRKDALERYESSGIILTQKDDETFFRYLDGTFASIRALFLNAFVFAQAVTALCVLLYMEPSLAAFNLASFAVFFYTLTLIKTKKSDNKNSVEKSDDAVMAMEDENVGITSKSFERLERMRIYGRNVTNVALFSSVIFGMFFSLPFMHSLDSLTLVLFLLRYITSAYSPIAVISAGCVPYKSNMVTVLNIENFISLSKELDRKTNSEVDNKSIALLFVCKSYKDRQDIISENISEDLRSLIKERLSVSDFKLITSRIDKDHPMAKSKITDYLNREYDGDQKIVFCV